MAAAVAWATSTSLLSHNNPEFPDALGWMLYIAAMVLYVSFLPAVAGLLVVTVLVPILRPRPIPDWAVMISAITIAAAASVLFDFPVRVTTLPVVAGGTLALAVLRLHSRPIAWALGLAGFAAVLLFGKHIALTLF